MEYIQWKWLNVIKISVKVPPRNILTLPENKRPASKSLGVWDHSNILSENFIAMVHAFSLKSQKNKKVIPTIKEGRPSAIQISQKIKNYPEKHSFEEENHLSNIHFLVFGSKK